MSIGGSSKARLGRMHEIMAGNVERGEVPDGSRLSITIWPSAR
jgi:hypothetical protein